MQAWIDLGVPAKQLNLGLATYGRSFHLLDSNQHGMGAPAGGTPPSGMIDEAGFYGFNDICANNGTVWTTDWDDVQKVRIGDRYISVLYSVNKKLHELPSLKLSFLSSTGQVTSNFL